MSDRKNTCSVIRCASLEEGLQVLQSHILTTSRYDFSVYEKRILYQLVLVAQRELEGRKIFSGKMSQLADQDPVDVEMKVSDILIGESDENYTRIKHAATSLMKKDIQYEDDEEWLAFTMLSKVRLRKKSKESTLRVTVNPVLWEVMLDFSRGFHPYELQAAMKFRSVYSMRFYELCSNPDKKYKGVPIPLEDVKAWFGLEKRYPDNSDFIKRVVKAAQKDLNENAPWSFVYELIKTGRKITHIKFIPIPCPDNGDKNLQKKVEERRTNISWDIPNRDVRNYLRDTIGFTTNELKNNRETWRKASAYFGTELYDILQQKVVAARKAGAKTEDDIKAYVVSAMQGKVKDYENIVNRANGIGKVEQTLTDKFSHE